VQLCGQRHESLGGAAGEHFQRGQFIGADIDQAGHVTRLRCRRYDEQGVRPIEMDDLAAASQVPAHGAR